MYSPRWKEDWDGDAADGDGTRKRTRGEVVVAALPCAAAAAK